MELVHDFLGSILLLSGCLRLLCRPFGVVGFSNQTWALVMEFGVWLVLDFSMALSLRWPMEVVKVEQQRV